MARKGSRRQEMRVQRIKKNTMQYFIGDTTQNTIYLTFDCGYENGNTELILDAAEKT